LKVINANKKKYMSWNIIINERTVSGCCVCVAEIANDKLAQWEDVAQYPVNVFTSVYLETATDFMLKNKSCM